MFCYKSEWQGGSFPQYKVNGERLTLTENSVFPIEYCQAALTQSVQLKVLKQHAEEPASSQTDLTVCERSHVALDGWRLWSVIPCSGPPSSGVRASGALLLFRASLSAGVSSFCRSGLRLNAWKALLSSSGAGGCSSCFRAMRSSLRMHSSSSWICLYFSSRCSKLSSRLSALGALFAGRHAWHRPAFSEDRG